MTKYFGFDTEVPFPGNIKVIATNEDVIEVTDFTSILDFLFQRKYRGKKFFLFNLRYDVEHILKASNNREFLQDVYDMGVRRPGISYMGCTFQYIPGKLFKICKNGHCVTFYDISQFYNHASLEKASKQYLPREYWKDTETVSAKRIGQEEGYYKRHREETMAYCKQDCVATLALAKKIEETFTKEGISFRTPISQAKISEMYVRDHYKYPKVPKALNEAHRWAFKAYHGGLFHTLQRGHFNQPVYSFDINSAYPAVMATLPHWANGKFKRLESAKDLKDCDYGWVGCKFDCRWIPMFEERTYSVPTGYKVPPNFEDIVYNNKRKIYPNGTRRQIVTKVEYDWMKAHNFPCTFEDGFGWTETNNKYPSPFEWMPKIYEKRIALKKGDNTGMIQYALKILLNGLYGKTAQAKKGMGVLTNFFYASYITAVTRLQVAEVALKNLSAVIEIATDSVTLTRDISAEASLPHPLPPPLGEGRGEGPVPKPFIIGDGLGEWGLDTYKEAIFIGSGMRQEWYAPEEHPHPTPSPSGGGMGRGERGAFVTYARGLTDKKDFDMLSFLEANRKSTEAWFVRNRPIHLGEMLTHHKALNYEDLGVFTDVRKRLNVNTDTKSNWRREYVDFGDFLDSEVMGGEPLQV